MRLCIETNVFANVIWQWGTWAGYAGHRGSGRWNKQVSIKKEKGKKAASKTTVCICFMQQTAPVLASWQPRMQTAFASWTAQQYGYRHFFTVNRQCLAAKATMNANKVMYDNIACMQHANKASIMERAGMHGSSCAHFMRLQKHHSFWRTACFTACLWEHMYLRR